MRRDGVWSSKRNKVVYGVSVVLLGRVCKASARAATDGQISRIHSQTGSSRPFEPLGAGSQAFREEVCKHALVWTDDQIRIPLGYRVWKKGGPSKFELALELLSYARNRLKCKPQFVLFDSWYPSKVILTRIRDYGWYFVCRLKKNRCFEGVALHKYLHQPYWQTVGFLTGKIKVFVVKYRRKYYATNRLNLTAPEVRQLYRLRQGVEEVIRALKSQLSLEGYQVGYRRSVEESSRPQPRPQEHHIALCLVAYLVVERERVDQRLTWRKLKRQLILKGSQTPLPSLERLRMAA